MTHSQVVIFPTLSGWWIDICTLTMFDSTLKDRMNSLYTAPGTTTFLHWLVSLSLNLSFSRSPFLSLSCLFCTVFTSNNDHPNKGRHGVCVLLRFFRTLAEESPEAWRALVPKESQRSRLSSSLVHYINYINN